MNAARKQRLHNRLETTEDQRAAFERDRDRLLYSDALRRLQGVTQVVSADEGWVFHNRLTHSIKVAQVARRIAEHLMNEEVSSPQDIEKVGGLSPDVAEAAALAHDLGHPPFGHVAEERLAELTEDIGFEGNAQSFRIVTQLEAHHGEYRGLNLTRATLAGILKYPKPRHAPDGKPRPKFGYYSDSESKEFDFARKGESDPAIRSLEAEIMDLADDITFAVHDTEDFYRAGMIPLHDLQKKDSLEHQRFLEDIRKRWGRQVDETEWEAHGEALREVLFTFAVNSAHHGTRDERVSIRRATSGLIGLYVRDGIRIKKDWKAGRRVEINEDIRRQLRMLKQLIWTYVIDRPSLATQ